MKIFAKPLENFSDITQVKDQIQKYIKKSKKPMKS